MTLKLGALFVVGAIVMAVFAVIASAQANLQSLGVDWDTWVAAALLSYFASLIMPGFPLFTYQRPPSE